MKNDNELWYKNAVFYEIYVRGFYDSNNDGHGDLRGVAQKLDYLHYLGVDCLWLLPTYPSPLKDDGYDIADYYGILSEYGTLEDFKHLVAEVHKRGMRLIVDLVMNHTSDQHPWFQEARINQTSPYRDYYVWSDTNEKYKKARIIFLDTESSNWTWDERTSQYYWHRFYASQPDLNYDNPHVRSAMLDIMRFWLELGVDGFRADAVPYLFEREVTNCENLPETHAYLKEIRKFIDEYYPGRILLAEANQWPDDVRPYFGDGDEFHMGFHFPVMPRIFMALRQGSRNSIKGILDRTPSIPQNCQWCIFLRNHDELTLEMVTEEEREWMWKEYAPDKRMRLNLGIRRRLAPLLENNQRKIELANSLIFTLPGSPIIYYGDEIGMGDNIELPDRNGVRTPMQWDNSRNSGFSKANPEKLYAPLIKDNNFGFEQVNVVSQLNDPDSLLNNIRKMIHLRKDLTALKQGQLVWVETGVDSIAAYWRIWDNSRLLIVNNLSEKKIHSNFFVEQFEAGCWRDILKGKELRIAQDGEVSIELSPFEYVWLISDDKNL
ncbi:MAG TPA: maltose alpha-D-glucosyltransferase [Anaerolineales bacterium]|nr:maltose alpha-D-glucosyltransferase [Anaerolineales bacterium]